MKLTTLLKKEEKIMYILIIKPVKYKNYIVLRKEVKRKDKEKKKNTVENLTITNSRKKRENNQTLK